jgi:hypothetical protein
MAITERDALERRVAQLEEKVRVLESRSAPKSREVATTLPAEEPLIDFTLIAKSILIVGGAYLLRALTELHVWPERVGMVVAFVYAVMWMTIAERALRRGRRTVAIFDAATGAMVAGMLIWEAATRFHALTSAAAAALTAIIALALLAVASLRGSDGIARVAAGLAVLTLSGLAIATVDVISTALAIAVVAVAALRLTRDVYSTSILLVAAHFFAAIASLFVLDGTGIAVAWSAAAIAAVLIGRRNVLFMYFAPLWAIGAVAASIVAGAVVSTLLATAAACVVALALLPAGEIALRAVMLAAAIVPALAALQSMLPLTAMHRTLILAALAMLLALAGRREATILSRIVLVAGAAKLIAEDARGSAAAMVVALVAYGLALWLVARRRPATA